MRRLNNKEIVDVLIEAKRILINADVFHGLCYCISNAYYRKYDYLCYEDIKKIIPKFNVDFLNARRRCDGYWWTYNDINSRIEALDKLIKYYRRRSLFYIIIDKINSLRGK